MVFFIKEEIFDAEVYNAGFSFYQKILNEGLLAEHPEESVYIGKFLFGANRIYDDTETEKKLVACVEKIICRFKTFASVNFEKHEQLKKDLLIHLKPAYFRMKYGLDIYSPMEKEIKETYSEVFELSQLAMAPFEQLIGKKIPENELIYIAVLFGGYLSQNNSPLITTKSLQIICSKGIGTSRFIENQLSQLLPERVRILPPLSLREYEQAPTETDLIVTTVPLKRTRTPVILVDPLLSESQKSDILQIIALGVETRSEHHILNALMTIIQQYTEIKDSVNLRKNLEQFLQKEHFIAREEKGLSLLDLLPENHILFKESVDSWEEAIWQASEPLLEEEYITPEYPSAMIENIHEFGPYIVLAPGVAMPHADPQKGVKQTGMSLLCLQEAVPFSVEPKAQVRFILVLASKDSFSHLRALMQWGKRIGNLEIFERMKQATTPAELRNVLGLNSFTKINH